MIRLLLQPICKPLQPVNCMTEEKFPTTNSLYRIHDTKYLRPAGDSLISRRKCKAATATYTRRNAADGGGHVECVAVAAGLVAMTPIVRSWTLV